MRLDSPETAGALAGANAEVTLAVRNLEAGERTATDITATWLRVRRQTGRGEASSDLSFGELIDVTAVP